MIYHQRRVGTEDVSNSSIIRGLKNSYSPLLTLDYSDKLTVMMELKWSTVEMFDRILISEALLHLSSCFSLLKRLCPYMTMIMMSIIIELNMITLILGFDNILLPILKRIKGLFQIHLTSNQLSTL